MSDYTFQNIKVNTQIRCFNQFGVKQDYNFIYPPSDIKESEQYCYVHKQNFIQQEFTLPSGKKYVSKCSKCRADERVDKYALFKTRSDFLVAEAKKQAQESEQITKKDNSYAKARMK